MVLKTKLSMVLATVMGTATVMEAELIQMDIMMKNEKKIVSRIESKSGSKSKSFAGFFKIK
jgi:hypothetical protein